MKATPTPLPAAGHPADSPHQVLGAHGQTVAAAQKYEGKREKSRRMRNLHAKELSFSRRAFERFGPDIHVLDSPCGTGRFLPVFSGAKQLTLVDLATNMLEVARSKTEGMGHVTTLNEDIGDLSLADDSVDLAHCMRLLHHFETDKMRLHVLKGLARVTRGRVVFSFYTSDCLRYKWRKLRGTNIRCHYVSKAHMAELCERAGLRVIDHEPKVNLYEQQCFFICVKSRPPRNRNRPFAAHRARDC